MSNAIKRGFTFFYRKPHNAFKARRKKNKFVLGTVNNNRCPASVANKHPSSPAQIPASTINSCLFVVACTPTTRPISAPLSTKMESYIQTLLNSSGVASSDVTIVDDNASIELSTALNLLSSDSTSSNSASKPCRWSNITEDMNDLRIAKRILFDLRRPRPMQSALNHPQSAPSLLRGGENFQQKHNFDFGNTSSGNALVGLSRIASANHDHRFNSSFPGNHPKPINRSNAGWDDNSLWKDATSLHNMNFPAKDNLQEISETNIINDDDTLTTGEDAGYDDDDDISETSIDILDDILEDWVVRKDLDSTSSIEKGSSSSSQMLKPKKFGSSADMTDTTDEMDSSYPDSSYQSILDYSKLVSNHRAQAPRLPQRKISQEKLRSLSSFLNSSSSLEGGNVQSNKNSDFLLFSANGERRTPSNLLPLIDTASQIVAAGARRRRRRKPVELKPKEVNGEKEAPSSPSNRDLDSYERARRLRDALGPMAPTFGPPKYDGIDDVVAGPTKSRWSNYRSKIKAEAAAPKDESPGSSISPPGTPKRKGGEKKLSSSSATNASSNSSSSNSSLSSHPYNSVDDSSSSARSLHSAHSVETVKSSNLHQRMPIIVDSNGLEESLEE